MFDFFKKQKSTVVEIGPSILGLRVGCSFDLDPLMLKLVDSYYTTECIAPTQIIEAAGVADMGDAKVYRFYTDDDAFLQVVASGGCEDQHVVDVKLFHFYNTLDVSVQADWDNLLNNKMGNTVYELGGQTFERVWQSESAYHRPVHFREETTSSDGSVSQTDQFAMLFERPVGFQEQMESLFVSAEEVENEQGMLSRCLVLSTGMTLTPANLTIHG